MFPPIIITIPLFPILNQLSLTDNHLTLVVLYTAFQVTITTWIMKAYIDSIPHEIEEAAFVDGATMWQVFTRILLPLSRPVLVATAIMAGTGVWNDFQFGFLFTSTQARTAPVLIGDMVGSLTGVAWGNVFAASVLQFLPALIFLWLIQNQLIRGMTSGSIKG
jgi:multiple sugar transport system permease protein